MKISELLTPSQILLPFAAADKWAAIRAMPVAWAEAGHLPPALLTPATDALLARERSVTTGMENGI
ncbi:MAG: hypothetical protein KDC87_20630, partial [Planctomycetes bacterium]|nr:hypothetical protein [Planctomycetota bacterium]